MTNKEALILLARVMSAAEASLVLLQREAPSLAANLREALAAAEPAFRHVQETLIAADLA